MTDDWDRALRSALAPARGLTPTEDEVRRALAAADTRAARRRHRPARLAVAGVIAVVLATTLQAVPPTRAAIEDVYGGFTGWLGNGDEDTAPGRRLRADDDAPAWIRDSAGEQRLIAQNGAVKLFAARTDDGLLSVALSDSVGLTDDADGWRRQLAEHKVVILGTSSFPGNRHLDAQGRHPFYGLTSRSVARVELRYDTGAPTAQNGLDGGFVLLADAHRKPRKLVAFDASGGIVEVVDASYIDLRVCTDIRGCPPGRFKP